MTSALQYKSRILSRLKVPVSNHRQVSTPGPFLRILHRLPLSGMRIADPTPVARGLAVAVACLAGIPAACRWIEACPALGFVALLLLVRFTASQSSLQPESEAARRSRPRTGPNRLRS